MFVRGITVYFPKDAIFAVIKGRDFFLQSLILQPKYNYVGALLVDANDTAISWGML